MKLHPLEVALLFTNLRIMVVKKSFNQKLLFVFYHFAYYRVEETYRRHFVIKKMEDVPQTCEDRNTSCEALEQPEGILQLIEKLENIVDQMLPG